MASDSEADALWRAATALNARAGGRRLPPLLFFTDPARTPEPWRIAGRLPAGAGVVYRGFGRPEAAEDAKRLRDISRERGLRLLIGADPKLAEAVSADGVHWPERLASEGARWRTAHPDWLMTAAWHPESGRAPVEAGLDALVVSPVLAPGGSSSGAPLGVAGLEAAVVRVTLPAYALGGITARNAADMADSGACGLAAVDGIVNAWGDLEAEPG